MRWPCRVLHANTAPGQVPLCGALWSGADGECGVGVSGVFGEGVDESAHGDFGEVAAFAVVPFLVLFEEDRADEAGDGASVGEDLDDVGAAFDLPVEAFDGVVGPEAPQV